ncbi:hypothetical protein C725_1237 [Pacificimonas flava]|uniref:Uncharacterized protein n=1 Tax=Pacificimonas flava TaxID=1234595 RepID=M2TNP6_9SPHN|nr:hypothetical protein C725_1237 [Pacificimonas flava]
MLGNQFFNQAVHRSANGGCKMKYVLARYTIFNFFLGGS